MDILATVKKTIVDHDLLASGDSVLVGLSGGPDSVALLHLLHRLSATFRLKLAAVYVNHQLRKRAALQEELFCQDLCDSLGLDLDIVEEDITALSKKRGKGIEETARDFRYGVFDLIAAEDAHNRIAVGHHQDDQTETLLFRIIRGTGPYGLQGIPIRRGKIIRPLMGVNRQQILDYLQSKGMTYCEDSSNNNLRLSRNYIRHRLLPDIRQRLNPQVSRALANLAELSGIEQAYLDSVTFEAVKRVIKTSPGGKFELVLSRFSLYDGAIQRRLLRHCLQELSRGDSAPDREVIERLIGLVHQLDGKISLPDQISAEVISDGLVLYRKSRDGFRFDLEIGKTCSLEWPALTIRNRLADGTVKDLVSRPRPRKIMVDWDKLRPPLFVRNVENGDRFRPLGMSGTKKIGDYFTDCRVPIVYRDEQGLVCDARGVVWVIGHQIDDRVKVDQKTRKVLHLEFSRRKKDQS